MLWNKLVYGLAAFWEQKVLRVNSPLQLQRFKFDKYLQLICGLPSFEKRSLGDFQKFEWRVHLHLHRFCLYFERNCIWVFFHVWFASLYLSSLFRLLTMTRYSKEQLGTAKRRSTNWPSFLRPLLSSKFQSPHKVLWKLPENTNCWVWLRTPVSLPRQNRSGSN